MFFIRLIIISFASYFPIGERFTIMGDTKLTSAVFDGDISTVKRLLKIKTLDVNHRRERDERTALMLAAVMGRTTMVKPLIEKGAECQSSRH